MHADGCRSCNFFIESILSRKVEVSWYGLLLLLMVMMMLDADVIVVVFVVVAIAETVVVVVGHVGSPFVVNVTGEVTDAVNGETSTQTSTMNVNELSHVGRDCQLTLKLPGQFSRMHRFIVSRLVVTTHFENLEKSRKSKVLREKSGEAGKKL